MKNIKTLSQKIAEAIEKILIEEFENEIVNDSISENHLAELNDENEAFENGIDDDEPVVEMEQADIDEQTIEFLKNRGKR